MTIRDLGLSQKSNRHSKSLCRKSSPCWDDMLPRKIVEVIQGPDKGKDNNEDDNDMKRNQTFIASPRGGYYFIESITRRFSHPKTSSKGTVARKITQLFLVDIKG